MTSSTRRTAGRGPWPEAIDAAVSATAALLHAPASTARRFQQTTHPSSPSRPAPQSATVNSVNRYPGGRSPARALCG